MKEQINRYARGTFEYNTPLLETEVNSVYGIVNKNKNFEGSIVVYERDGRELKGVAYSDNDRVSVITDSFFGSRAEIAYSVDTKGIIEGSIIEGNFKIISNGGEDNIPFSFRVESSLYESTDGTKVKNLFHFANLAQNNPQEAIELMKSENFEDMFLGDNMSIRALYQGIMRGRDDANNLEEFLIAVHKKNKVNLVIEKNSRIFENITENFKDTILLECDCWGYVGVNVSTNVPFIRLERRFIDTDSFSGGKYEYSYIVDYSMLHKGSNFAEIIFRTYNRELKCSITVVVKDEERNEEAVKNRRLIKKLDCDMMSLYVNFRTHKINLSQWVRETAIVIEAVRAIDDSNPFYRLALAQVYITEGRSEEAKNLIENVKDEILAERPEDFPVYCYFIYINTLYNKDHTYSRKASQTVNECYKINKDWRILWTLLFMDEEFEQNPSLKLLRIKEQYNDGCSSPILYVEACIILNEHPELLRVLNSFEINIIYFGAKNGLLDKKLSGRIAQMTAELRYGNNKLIRMMEAVYSIYDDNILLEAICKFLIRNNCEGPEYFEYYRKGIEKELRITRLFEYYLNSRNMEDMSPLPKMVLMYFSYNNSLDYIRKAYLYTNIIHNKTDNPQIYRSYLPQMEKYVMEQLSNGRINDNLAVLYRILLNNKMITAENAAAVSEICFTYKVVCKNPDFKKVVVRHKEGITEKEYLIVNSVAYIRMYTEDAALFFVNDDGNRYSVGVQYSLKRMIDGDSILRKCLEEDSSLNHVKLNECEKSVRYQKKTMDFIEKIIEMISWPELNMYYKNSLISVVVDYFYDNYDAEGFVEFVNTIDVSLLDTVAVSKIIEIYIIIGEYSKAYHLIRRNTYGQIIPKRLMRLCSRLITSNDIDLSDANNMSKLTSMCYFVFVHGRCDIEVLKFLVKNYNGTVKDMLEIWKRADGEGIETYDLEERIIAQMMFSHVFSDMIENVFDRYFAKGPRTRIVEAYLAYHSYLYFVKEKIVSEQIFTIMESMIETETELVTVCKLALLKYYSEITKLNKFQKMTAEQLMEELVRKEYIFPFYKEFKDENIVIPDEIVDKTIVEYRTDPSTRVVIHYVFEDKEHGNTFLAEDMKNVYEGIFIKSFVMFYGETLQYYVEEGDNITESRRIINRKVSPDISEGRYNAINDILACHDLHDMQTYQKLVWTYAGNEYVTRQLFKPL